VQYAKLIVTLFVDVGLNVDVLAEVKLAYSWDALLSLTNTNVSISNAYPIRVVFFILISRMPAFMLERLSRMRIEVCLGSRCQCFANYPLGFQATWANMGT
jgi:hypothetical protein